MNEQVLVVDAQKYKNNYGVNDCRLIEVSYNDYISFITNNCTFIDRSLAEVNPKYKQIVSYCVIRYKDFLFTTKRLKKQTESRLHDKLSIGIGGHINNYDSKQSDNIIIYGCNRELNEEVDIKCKYNDTFLGIINDNSSEVNSVHSGVCFSFELENMSCFVNETEKMEGKWLKIEDIKNIYFNKLEKWSQIVFNSIFNKDQSMNKYTGLNNKNYQCEVSSNYLCVPTVLKYIIDSENLEEMSVNQISDFFGVNVPIGYEIHNIHNVNFINNKKLLGVVIKNDSINNFFMHFKYPLHEQYIGIRMIDKDFFSNILSDYLRKGYHIICGYDYSCYDKTIDEYTGHVSLIIDIEGEKVSLINPGPKDFGIIKMDAVDLYSAILRSGDGIWLITKTV